MRPIAVRPLGLVELGECSRVDQFLTQLVVLARPNRRTNGWQQAARWRPTRPPTTCRRSFVVEALIGCRLLGPVAPLRRDHWPKGYLQAPGVFISTSDPRRRCVALPESSTLKTTRCPCRSMRKIEPFNASAARLNSASVVSLMRLPSPVDRVVALDDALHDERRTTPGGLSRP